MARPQRNNVDYFPFLCEEGEKMFYLEETYGNDGFATFVKLLRELAKVDYHYLNLSKPSSMMFLSAKCKVSKEVLNAIISDLVELGKFDRLLWEENSIVWCQDFIDSIQDAYSKRTNSCVDYNSLLTLLGGLGVRKLSKSTTKPSKQPSTVPVKPQRIVKDTKVDESKEDKFPFKSSLLDYGFKEQLVNDWLLVRKKKSATNSQTAYTKFINQVELSTLDKDQILEVCIEKDWKAFNHAWKVEVVPEKPKDGVLPKSNYNPTG